MVPVVEADATGTVVGDGTWDLVGLSVHCKNCTDCRALAHYYTPVVEFC